MIQAFDYIVVGAGSAGCVAASRLAAEHGFRVLLLEAGPSDDSPLIKMPAGTFKIMFGKSPFLKRYRSKPQQNLNGRSVIIPQGNVVGGGSSVNVMAYTRGSRQDYDLWNEASGMAGWGWDDMVPHFRKQEGNVRLEDAAHSGDGPLRVSDPPYIVDAANLYLRTMQRMGVPYTSDFTAGTLNGVGYIQSTTYRGVRCSSSDAFLKPALRSQNLTVVTKAQVRRILFDGKRATGVEYKEGGKIRFANATREIVLTAGAFVSPKILMLSGIGPGEHLKQHGIEVKVDLPGVGSNLQDHNEVFLCSSTKGPFGYFGEDKGFKAFRNLLNYMAFKGGPISSNGGETMAFVNLDDPEAEADIQIYMLAIMWPTLPMKPRNAVTLMINLVKPLSRGSVRLRSSNPDDDAEIDPNWFSHPEDTRRLLNAFRYSRKILATEPLASIIQEELSPGSAIVSDDDLIEYMKRSTESNYHPVGTCRMGRVDDPSTVVGPDLRVNGVEGVRVLDASMMPKIISANTNATAMAVADKGVDLMTQPE
jgi:choline dehydrogenase